MNRQTLEPIIEPLEHLEPIVSLSIKCNAFGAPFCQSMRIHSVYVSTISIPASPSLGLQQKKEKRKKKQKTKKHHNNKQQGKNIKALGGKEVKNQSKKKLIISTTLPIVRLMNQKISTDR